MSKTIRFLSLFLVCLLLFSFGCDKCDGGSQPEEPGNQGGTDIVLPSDSDDIEVEYADSYFVRDGRSGYVIVIPEKYSEDELFAAHEINTFLEKACGVTLEIKTDRETNYNSESKIISIGRTKFLSTVGITPSFSEIGEYGFILKTVGSSVFIAGATDVGTGALNGTYEFLRYQIGWKCYSYDEFYYNEFESVKLVDVNVTDKPDIPGYIGSSFIGDRTDFMRRLRTTNRVGVLGKGSVSPYHNMLLWLPTHLYYDEHPKWYNSKLSQLCLTAHGDENEYNLMIDTVFEKMYTEVMTYDLDAVTWTLMDNWDPCECDACKAARTKYGARSGQLVKTCNDLSEKFEQRFKEEGIDKEISILFFAYYYYTEPPKNESIKCRDNVYPLIIPYNEMDRAASIYDNKNANIKGIIDEWSKLCKKFGFWVYSVNFGGSYFFPFDPFSCLQENYTYFASMNPFYMYDEGFTSQFAENVTGFTALKEYLSANVAWDNDADVYKLTTSFFRNYFKDAAEDMYAFFIQYRIKLQILFEDFDYSHSLNMDCLKQEYFELGTLLTWKNHIENAYKSIEKYKESDPALHEKLDTRIRTESLMVNYMIWKLYGSYYTSTEQETMVRELYDDCNAVCMLTGTHWKPVNIGLGIEE